jgi:CHAD domain-containing protein
MAFRISAGVPFGDDIRRIAREQIDGAVAETCDGLMPDDERIHSVRKRCKKLRGLLRLIRPCLDDTYGRENAHFRDAAQVLAPLRDEHAVLAAFDAVVAHFDGEVECQTFAPLRRRLAQRERQLTDLKERVADVRGRLEAARERLAAWPLDGAVGAEGWRGGFERTYRQARRALAAAYEGPTSEHFHEWRKSVKYHWHHARLLSPLWDQALTARVEVANSLGELLGLHHDLAVLRSTLADLPAANGEAGAVSFVALIDRHQEYIEATARPLGMRLFAEKASQIGTRYAKYWAAWSEELQGRAATVRQVVRASA